MERERLVSGISSHETRSARRGLVEREWDDLTRSEREALASSGDEYEIGGFITPDLTLRSDEIVDGAAAARRRLRSKRAGAYAARRATAATAAAAGTAAGGGQKGIEAQSDERTVVAEEMAALRSYERHAYSAELAAGRAGRKAARRLSEIATGSVDEKSVDGARRKIAERQKRRHSTRKKIARAASSARENGLAATAASMPSHVAGTIKAALSPSALAGGAARLARGALLKLSLLLLPLVLGAALIPSCAAALIAGAASSGAGSSLSEVEGAVYAFLSSKGLDSVHAAAIMGNMKAESGMDPHRIESNGVGIGLCQWSYGRADKLRAYAESKGTEWYDLETQLEFFWEHDVYHLDWSGSYRVSGGYADPSPPPGTLVSGSKRGFLTASTVEEATEQFCYGWERPGFPRIDQRIAYARGYLAILEGLGGGEDYASATDAQRSVVDAARTTPSPGAGLCAWWVTDVYSRAGAGHPTGNACDMYWRYCTSSDRSQLKVGMIIAVPTHPHTSFGKTYGHVGIYVGDGKVMHNAGTIDVMDLDKWIGYYGQTSTPKWGWGGPDLSAS
ncbi:MAG: phage tail tip lysozyme [Collinsella sp.]|nr:phage tail tip lysozyme [Collinsella sp.]